MPGAGSIFSSAMVAPIRSITIWNILVNYTLTGELNRKWARPVQCKGIYIVGGDRAKKLVELGKNSVSAVAATFAGHDRNEEIVITNLRRYRCLSLPRLLKWIGKQEVIGWSSSYSWVI
ncbi:hypothetical protein Trydic_g20681 [Trypoxylus dichotomus]